ncbi:MAG TPA: AarF/UbiB family protein [Solirubrobacteraceae bacterium]
MLATRRDLLPGEFIDELSGLQDDAAQVAWPDIEQVLSSELRAEVDDVFESFDRTPLAAASIAQVHAATLGTRERVVVKVRRPGIETVVAWDLDSLTAWRSASSVGLAGGTVWARSTCRTVSRKR